ncbi:3-deoxy-8-phosphooctulonate synthase [Desulfatibacillum aliphaticivorans]|uniref:3-deoxy-8-phosphooctulonate synthase n=1 Tax=Desulfatibacillum aliphaticivorans TaxID=218208 RepID=UPI00041D500D|nr:3-deoxy-8-phosphooctulonate synthase [Desulfatibacillum aliphaticivorans]
MTNTFSIGNNMNVGLGAPLLLIAGPCVIENEEKTLEIAERIKGIVRDMDVNFVFKASFDKANRTSIDSFRGPGLEQGLAILGKVKSRLGLPVISDVHSPDQVGPASEVLDILQIPAFLCRQTDLLTAAGNSGKPVNVKKGQFVGPWDMKHVTGKVLSTGNERIMLTERGSSFGYNNLVVDFRNFSIMRDLGFPVVFDATHSVQMPGGLGNCSGGDRSYVPLLARAAAAAGVDGVFFEVHTDPDKALCDGPNSLTMEMLESILPQLLAIRKAAS